MKKERNEGLGFMEIPNRENGNIDGFPWSRTNLNKLMNYFRKLFVDRDQVPAGPLSL